MLYIDKTNAVREYRSFHPITDVGYDILMDALVQSSLVRDKWLVLGQSTFLIWASAIGGLSLGLATARLLDQRLQAVLG